MPKHPTLLFALIACLCPTLVVGDSLPPSTSVPPLRALIVGGGPEPDYNPIALESNVRYLHRLLPPQTASRTLFANGKPHSRVVLYTDPKGRDHFRATVLKDIDGPAGLASFEHEVSWLASEDGSTPRLLYFTGHGSPDDDDYDNNAYDLWGNETLSVTRLASLLAKMPSGAPVTVVMVQCFSGAFGNLLFQNGDPHGAAINQNLCGFFASIASREAAGCTSEVNEADYHDFTSSFFAALCGISRVGKPVIGADYTHDGKVGMNEAFAYALIHDPSIDTPVCTSDVFLRRYVPVRSDHAIFEASYAQVLSWAQPAQRAVLEALSTQLRLSGDNRLALAYAQFRRRSQHQGSDAQEELTARWTRYVRLAKTVVLAHRLQAEGAPAVQARYATLLAAEASNPLRPAL